MRFVTIVVGNIVWRVCFTATAYSMYFQSIIYIRLESSKHTLLLNVDQDVFVTTYAIVLRSDFNQRLMFPFCVCIENTTKSNNNLKRNKGMYHQPLLLLRYTTNTQYLPSKRLKLSMLSTQFHRSEKSGTSVVFARL